MLRGLFSSGSGTLKSTGPHLPTGHMQGVAGAAWLGATAAAAAKTQQGQQLQLREREYGGVGSIEKSSKVYSQ